MRSWLRCSPVLALALTACAASTPTTSSLRAPQLQLPMEGGFLGGFVLDIDREAGTVALLPDATAAAIGDTFSEIGLGPALQERFGKNFRVRGLRSTGPTTIEVDFETTHPFSAATRPDLAIFNLKCWVVSSQPATNLGEVQVAPGLVTNADGYGRLWAETAVTSPAFSAAVVQPYVVLREDPTAGAFSHLNPAGYNVFFPGMTSVDTVALDLGTATSVQLRIYLTADYGQSAVRATRQNPQYELPKFAGNAPWKIAVTELNNFFEAGQLSSADYQVDIWDWKHGESLGSDVIDATLDIPGVMAAPVTLALTGTGTDPTPLTGTISAFCDPSVTAGDYWGLVSVTDQATSGVGLNEDFEPVTITNYSTWQCFPVSVAGATAVPPTAEFTACNFLSIKAETDTHFDGSLSTPGTHPIVSYEWDFDYIDPTFDVMATGSTVDYEFPAAGNYQTALRVSDGFGNSHTLVRPVSVSGPPVWQTPLRLTTNSIQEVLCELTESPDSLVVTSDGTAHLVFSIVQSASPFATEYWYMQLPSTCDVAGSWTAPENFFTTPASQQITRKFSLAATSDNTVHALLNQRDGSSRDQLIYRPRTAGGWGTQEVVMTHTNNTERLTGSTIAASPDGTLGVLTVLRTTQPSCPGTPAIPWQLQFVKRTSGSWGSVSTIGLGDIVVNIPTCGNTGHMYGYGATLAATGTNEWVAVWDEVVTPFDGFTDQNTGPSKLSWAQTVGGVWQAEANLYTSAGQYRHPILERSPNGTLWLIARAGSTGSPIGLARYSSGTWDSDMTIVLPGGLGSTPYFSLNFDDDGRGTFAVTYQNSNVPFNSKRFRQTDTPAAISGFTPHLVEPTLSTFRYPAMIAGLHDGRYVAVWSTLKYGGAFFSGFELDAALYQ